MPLFAYHASHEQFAPSELLRLAVKAGSAGFDAIHSSDHFNPWSRRQGHSGFSFSWVAAALQASHLPVSMICTPGQRYHPAIVAQAIATLAEMYPGRFSVEMASGEALNESITGDAWPSKDDRNGRLLESVHVIRQLLAGETVDHNGLVRVKQAKIWSRPAQPPSIFCAAISPKTSAWCGAWADGLITTSGKPEELSEKINAFESNGGAGKPVHVQYSFSFAKTREDALDAAHDQWRSNLLPREQLADLRTTQQFDEATDNMTRGSVAEKLPMISSMEQLFEELGKISHSSVQLISLHNVNRNHDEFIQSFGSYKKK